MTPTPPGQVPEALQPDTALLVARNCRETGSDPSCPFFARVQLMDAAYVLERLHAENATLQSGYDAARLEIESLHARVQELELERDGCKAARDLLAERARQVQEEGWTPEHDDEHSCGEMAEAAACYAASARVPTSTKRRQCPGYWPWAAKWWKPSDQRRDLIKAGALILAELERIDRATRKQGGAA